MTFLSIRCDFLRSVSSFTMDDPPSPPPTIPGFADLTEVGLGTFSSVYSATHVSLGLSVAIKILNRPEVEIDAEIAIQRTLDHPFIAFYFGELKSPRSLILEFGGQGTLLDLVLSRGFLHEFEARDIFCQLASAISYLHESKRVVHADLKLENIVIGSHRIVKVVDFGSAFQFEHPRPSRSASLAYASPEVFCGCQRTTASDIWSLGVVLYAVLTGEMPFGGEEDEDIAREVMQSEPAYPEELSEDALHLLRGMLTKDPQQRMDIPAVRTHPWLRPTAFRVFLDANALTRPEFTTLVLHSQQLEGIPVEEILEAETERSIAYRERRRAQVVRNIEPRRALAIIKNEPFEEDHPTPSV
jgi:serine/threonine protein kinase